MRLTNRWSIALCSGLVILTACDTTHAPLTAIPEEAPAASLAPAPSGLIAFYSFDQGPGNGQVKDAIHTATGGYEGGAYQFDGSGDYIDLPININPSVRPQVTMGAWVRVGSLAYQRSQQILSHDDGGFDRSIDLDQRGLNGGSAIDGKHRFSAFTGTGVLPGTVADTARWVFVAGVYTETSVTLYVDGQQYTNPARMGEGFSTLRVGGNPGAPAHAEVFHGTIDNVFVYDRALTAAEIATIRAGGACAIQGTCEAPRRMHFYPFDTGPGDGLVKDAVHQSTAGYEGGAYYFDGAGDYIDLPINVNPSQMPRVTMGAWMKVASLPVNRSAQILSHDNGGWDRSLVLDQRGRNGWMPIDGQHRVSAFYGDGVLPGPVAQPGEWTFVAAVYDETSVTLYVDGQRYSREAWNAEGFPFLRVGGNPGAPVHGEAFHGWIDNVFVVNRALSDGEIADIRTGGACVLAGTPCNRAPTVQAGGAYAAAEGSPVALELAAYDPDGDSLSVAWDLGDGTTGTGAPPAWHTYADDGTYTVAITATDPAGLSSTESTTAEIINVRPTVLAFAGASLVQGQTYAASVSFSDPGADTWTATVDYGDGSGVQPLALNGKTAALAHTYQVPGTYTVRVSVRDDDDATPGTASAVVRVASLAEGVAQLKTLVAQLLAAGALSENDARQATEKLDQVAGNLAEAAAARSSTLEAAALRSTVAHMGIVVTVLGGADSPTAELAVIIRSEIQRRLDALAPQPRR